MLADPGNMMTARPMTFRAFLAEKLDPTNGETTVSSTLPPLGTLDEIAVQMTHGFWGGDDHHFNVTQGGTITVNLTGITADARTVAHAALAVWSDIIGVTFQEVSSGAQITFDDLAVGTGAFSESQWEDGTTIWATVNVSEARLGTGPGIMRGGLHTYIHEIGHALGLGHTAFANAGTAAAVYPNDALWRNDGSAISVMSYFDNGENSYYADQGFTNNLVTTPQVADIIAIGNLYGYSATTRTGDTTYGFNNNSGREMFDAAAHPHLAYTIFDSGGIDTLDYSGFANNQVINLNAEAFSNVGPAAGNVVIARGVLIENAIGGSGSDMLIGNAVANLLDGRGGSDMLTGGAGNDTFSGTKLTLGGDTITDLAIGDRIVITDATPDGFAFSFSGGTLTYAGGSLTLQGVTGTLTASAAAGGGVQLTIGSADGTGVVGGRHDFNGDGRDDILWRHDNGAVTNWLGQASGGFVSNANANAGIDWHIAGTGDFNGDGSDDILWRNANGDVTNWLAQANSFASNFENAYYEVATNWQVTGTGDFNGDGRDDILWRHQSGQLTNWLGQANGGFVSNANANAGTDWQVASIGDFNGDGRDDVLWRNFNTGELTDWLGQAGGSFASNFEDAYYQVELGWQVAGVGDFNDDGRDDVLWRHDSGAVINWLGQTNGGFGANANANAGTDWQVASIGDFNGDGRDDVLWRNDDGAVTNWLGQANGSFASNFGNAYYQVDNSWQVQPSFDSGAGDWDY